MDRLEPVPLKKMNTIQRELHDRIASQRSGGQVAGPFSVLLHAPEICDPVSSFIDHLMSDTRLPHNLKEITILVIAKAYSAPYEWVVHERRARRVGVLDSVIEAIRKGNSPHFHDPDEKLIFEITTEMIEKRHFSEDTYSKALATLGKETLVEFVVLLGFYISVAVLLVSFDVAGPDGINPFTKQHRT